LTSADRTLIRAKTVIVSVQDKQAISTLALILLDGMT
jgi:hypothetical protein